MSMVFSGKVFDDMLYGAGPHYTDASLNGRLGACDKLAIQCLADITSGTTPTIAVAIEHSSDGRNWKQKNGAAEIPAVTLAPGVTNSFTGGDAGTSPSLGYVRLAITLGGTGPAGHVELSVCGRDA
jgi:hypothetical protein